MQRTTWECDRCHRQYHEGDTRRPNSMNDLPDRWRQVFRGGTLTYELCEHCGEALTAFCEGHALVAGTVEPVKLSAAVLRLQQMHARIAPFTFRPDDTSPEHEVATALCEVIELLLESVQQKDKEPDCQCGHSTDKHCLGREGGCVECSCTHFQPGPRGAWPCECGHKHTIADHKMGPSTTCEQCECKGFKPAFVAPSWPCECGHGKAQHPNIGSDFRALVPCQESGCGCPQFKPAVPSNG